MLQSINLFWNTAYPEKNSKANNFFSLNKFYNKILKNA